MGKTRKEKRTTASGDEYFVRVPDVDEADKPADDSAEIAALQAIVVERDAEIAGLRFERDAAVSASEALGERVDELEAQAAQTPALITLSDPPAYVDRLVDALLSGQPIDFQGASVPDDVQKRLAEHTQPPAPAETRAVEPPAPVTSRTGKPAARGKAQG